MGFRKMDVNLNTDCSTKSHDGEEEQAHHLWYKKAGNEAFVSQHVYDMLKHRVCRHGFASFVFLHKSAEEALAKKSTQLWPHLSYLNWAPPDLDHPMTTIEKIYAALKMVRGLRAKMC